MQMNFLEELIIYQKKQFLYLSISGFVVKIIELKLQNHLV